jgi:hypothetical protein
VRPPRDERRGTVGLLGIPDADQAAGAEAGEQAVTDDHHAPQPEDARAGVPGENAADEERQTNR